MRYWWLNVACVISTRNLILAFLTTKYLKCLVYFHFSHFHFFWWALFHGIKSTSWKMYEKNWILSKINKMISCECNDEDVKVKRTALIIKICSLQAFDFELYVYESKDENSAWKNWFFEQDLLEPRNLMRIYVFIYKTKPEIMPEE